MHREDYMAMHCRQHQFRGHEAIVKLLLEKGADVNAQEEIWQCTAGSIKSEVMRQL
jgi:hypothetical protein